MSHVGVALTFGLIVLAMIYAIGDVSGCHMNPAVTLGFFVARRFEGRWVLPYIASQTVGAVTASLALRLMFPLSPTLGGTLPSGSATQSFLLELILTFMLMFVVLSVSTGSKEKGVLAGVAVGSVIALEALFAGPICGASMNPIRSLAPALVAWRFEHLWIYLTAPCLGAAASVLACRCVHGESCCGSQSPTTESVSQMATKRVVFVCVENSNRSQMAEAFARIHGAGNLEAYSAGSRPSGRVNPKAIASMNELGYDLSSHQSKSLADLASVEFDVAVTMGCGDECPFIKAKRHEDWKIPDPKEMPPEQFREVRNLIKRR